MKAFVASLVLVAVSTPAVARTIAAQTLKCGGYIGIDVEGDKAALTVVKVGQSTCSNLKVESLGINAPLTNERTSVALNLNSLGSTLPAVVNDEVVLLAITNDGASTASAEDQERLRLERERLQIERQRAAREKAQADREAARRAGEAAGTAVGVIIGGGAVVIEEIGRGEH